MDSVDRLFRELQLLGLLHGPHAALPVEHGHGDERQDQHALHADALAVIVLGLSSPCQESGNVLKISVSNMKFEMHQQKRKKIPLPSERRWAWPWGHRTQQHLHWVPGPCQWRLPQSTGWSTSLWSNRPLANVRENDIRSHTIAQGNSSRRWAIASKQRENIIRTYHQQLKKEQWKAIVKEKYRWGEPSQ